MTYSEAIDELFGVCKAALDLAVTNQIVPALDQRFAGQPNPDLPSVKHWCRSSYQTVTDEQSTLSNADQVRRYEANGLFYLQVFCPVSMANSVPMGRLLCESVQAVFRKPSPSGVMTFHAAPIREQGETNSEYGLVLMVKCQYENIQ